MIKNDIVLNCSHLSDAKIKRTQPPSPFMSPYFQVRIVETVIPIT